MAVVLDSMQLREVSEIFGHPWEWWNLHSAVDLGEIAVGHHLWWLIADANLEASRAPVHELDCTLSLESGNGTVHILGHDVTAVEQARSHVLPVARIALHHLVVRLETGHRDLLDGIGLVGCLGSGDDWGVGNEWEVNTGIWHKVGLEFVEIDVERAVEAQGGSDRRYNWRY